MARKSDRASRKKPASSSEKGKVASQLEELAAKIRVCKLCRLHGSRTKAVPGSGNTELIDIMFIGEGPGRKEDESGEPFVGAAGRVLNEMLADAGLERSKVFITNIVKCRPPQNRKPLPDEIKTCTSNYLDRQIELLNPKLICTLGVTALEYFTGEKKMGPSRGKLARTKEGRPLFPTYHPASVFRNRSLRSTLEQDIKKLGSFLKELES